ncbi:hypothetical protein BDV93DRAFT_249962 [Ceratobasidium sp. AG-I]|nr:hypothetical protein BDV93DRAFT_249962 [Ceratobasidium sp. AG-I]
MPETMHAQQACDSCRRRRRKVSTRTYVAFMFVNHVFQCDRRIPLCSPCERRNEECVYDATVDQRRPAQKNYVTALEARVALLEAVLRGAGASDVAGPIELVPIEEVNPTPVTQAQSLLYPVATTKPEPEPIPESDAGFVLPDDAAQAFARFAHLNPAEPDVTVSEEFDLGMSGYVPLVNLETEHKLLAQFWD